MSDKRDVRLPEELCAQAERKFGTKFASLEELLAFVLSELLREDSSQADEAEQEMVKERLRELGYI
jgi:hypothetical protein